jgi:hypothetical protein
MKKITFILSITLTLSAFAQVPNYVPTYGLVGWWPLDGNINDYSMNSLNGSTNGVFSVGHDGIQNTAVSLNGSNQMITLPGSNLYDTDNFSIHFWTKANSYNIHNKIQYGVIAGAGRFSMNWSLSSLSFSPMTCSGQYAPNGNGTSASGLNTNVWYNVVYTISGSTTNFYVNGNLIDTQSNASTLNCFQSNMNLYFGGDILGGAIEYYSGVFDNIGVWNRVLSANEVFTLYNGCQQSILTQPQSQSVNFNDNVQFTAASSDQSATYQWETNVGAGFQNLSDAGQYSGTSTNTLNVSNVGMLNVNQEFRCVIQSGSCTDTTDIATLQVCGSILSQPSNESVLLNTNAQFTFSSTDPNATYQWQTNLGLGFQNLTDAGQYSGSSTNTLNVSNVTLSNNNQQFRCILNSGSCTDTSDVALLSVVNNVGLDEQNQMQLFVYPNPTSSIITIENPQGLNSNFLVVDAQGREVHSGTLNTTTTLNLHAFPTGIYTILFENKELKEMKVVKE